MYIFKKRLRIDFLRSPYSQEYTQIHPLICQTPHTVWIKRMIWWISVRPSTAAMAAYLAEAKRSTIISSSSLLRCRSACNLPDFAHPAPVLPTLRWANAQRFAPTRPRRRQINILSRHELSRQRTITEVLGGRTGEKVPLYFGLLLVLSHSAAVVYAGLSFIRQCNQLHRLTQPDKPCG